jgi:hypothetical protein
MAAEFRAIIDPFTVIIDRLFAHCRRGMAHHSLVVAHDQNAARAGLLHSSPETPDVALRGRAPQRVDEFEPLNAQFTGVAREVEVGHLLRLDGAVHGPLGKRNAQSRIALCESDRGQGHTERAQQIATIHDRH